MTKNFTFLFFVLFLFGNIEICVAQDANKNVPLENMPAFVKELQQPLPSREMMRNNPDMYEQLFKRRQKLSLLLINEVRQHKLPQSALQFLQPQHSAENNIVSSNSFPDKTTGGNFHLVKDINQSKNSYPSNGNYYYTYAKSYAVLNNVIYYAADDGIHGTELWRSDGTDTGTYMVKNINPGNASSYPNNITTFNDKIYFSAFKAGRRYELYQSDGTTAGTILFRGFNAGVADVSDITVAKDELYFVTYEAELWKTDGTVKGTVLVKNLDDSLNAYDLQQLVSVNDNVFFTAYDHSHGREVWYSNGTAAGTHMVKDINPDSADNFFFGPMNLTVYNGKLYFSAFDGYIRTLWKTDGTTVGTKNIMHDVQIESALGVPIEEDVPFAIAKSEMYFAGYTSSTGNNLYKYNFSTGNTTLVKTLSPDGKYIPFYSESIRSMNDSIYFSLSNAAGTGYDLWKSGGISTNTNIIKSFSGAIDIYNFYSIGKKIYFNANSTESGNELWISDGTSAGTKLLKDINTGAGSSNPSEFTLCKGKIYFSAYSPAGGIELWKTDGTSANTKQVKDINTTSSASAVNNGNLINLNANEIIFPAFTPETGTELWKSDGTEAGTVLVKDLVPGEAGIYPTIYESKNGKVYFSLYNDTSKANDIYVTNGTNAGTKRIVKVIGSLGTLQVADNGIVFYTLYDYNTSNYLQLWRIDSSSNNFRLSLNINNVNGLGIGVAGNICYFCDGATGKLWESNGAINGTKVLANNISDASFFATINNKIIFTANSFDKGSGLWISDGTINGTILLKNMSVNINSGTAILSNKLYFSGSEGIKGNELYRTDGTPAGTKLVKDITPGEFYSSNPANFTTVKSSVFFTATDDTGQRGLWKTSGTSANTQLVKELAPNSYHYNINNFSSAGGELYFIDSTQLWISDGTDTGTHVIIDPSNITSIYSLAAAGNKLFFSGYSYTYGTELYIGDGTLGIIKTESNAIAKTLNKPLFNAQLLANPFTNSISININSPLKQQLQITISNTAGQILTAKAINVNTGYNLVTLDAMKYLHGMYLINISSFSGTISLKAVK